MADEQYLTEKHYVVCDKGVAPKKMKVTSQDFVTFSGDKAATELDTLKGNNFICLGKTAFIAGAVAGIAVGICAMIPGPGWLVAAIIAAAILAAVAIGALKCKAAAATRKWTNTAQKFSIEEHKALTLSSIMVCPAEGGTITPKETAWEAWGSAALTNLGHVANFAFGFLAGRGGTAMVTGAGSAAMGAATLREGATTFARSFGQQFMNTARKELIEQFTFKGFKNAPFFCKLMRGAGIGGAYYDQYNIWSSDKSALEKLQESGVSLILGIFAAKGATLVCFPAGTKVHAQKGLVNIEDLLEGDLVLTYNEETKQTEYKAILVKHERYTMQMLSLELPTGEFVRVTPEHRFFCNDEWIEARDLSPGDVLHLKGGHYTTIISVETLPHYEKVYNFDIEDNENYYVTEDGILVHNGYKIDEAESAGGHSIERHGSQLSEAEMQQRVLGTHPSMPQSRTAMKFDSPEVHQSAVDAAFDAKKADIDEHFANGGDYKEWEYDYGSQTGTGYTNTQTRSNPNSVPVSSNKVTIAMKPDGNGGYTLDSAYPSYP
ncbi:intein C-terminal splicing region/intein N-terminal splicing region [Chryseobacterium oleae]|uniref:Intein C-terminal splicing region/intein N-terminal splicing region n=1 Tax=Chryseobacterium oleae TaxID=491207 RepID=A0A1I4ZFP7_CHROL|nr:polymorphic toxin-type HINT domain-containing protein [Chryseobacterium oleae]SFN49086.1 intein C-terminal splicing region/intein N-terminal splicing region [Chryseobacterium oleae]